jgi:hypothetical protein
VAVQISADSGRTYRTLSPQGRIMLGCGILAWGAIGLLASNTMGDALGIQTTKQDEEKLNKVLPKIHVVERDSPETSPKGPK